MSGGAVAVLVVGGVLLALLLPLILAAANGGEPVDFERLAEAKKGGQLDDDYYNYNPHDPMSPHYDPTLDRNHPLSPFYSDPFNQD